LERKRLSTLKSFMSIQKSTFKYKECEMAVEGAYNHVMVAMNENEEIEIVECQVCILVLFHSLKFSFNIRVEFGIEFRIEVDR